MRPPGCTCPERNRRPDGSHSDAAKRAADMVNLHLFANPGGGAVRRWVAVALADGRSDQVLYDSKRDAVRHQHHNEQLYAFICISPGGMSVCEAESFLRWNRLAYDAGFRLPDPGHRAGGRQLIPRITNEDQARQLRALRRAIR